METWVPIAALVWYVLWGVVAFVAYWRDKRAAVRGAWRVKEATLHWIGAAGGWVGALVAQRVLRHKRKKASFWVVTWGTGVVHVAVWVGVGWLIWG